MIWVEDTNILQQHTDNISSFGMQKAYKWLFDYQSV